MFQYDKNSRILKVQKIKPVDIEIDLLKDQKLSYQKYISETIHKDVEYLCGKILEKTNIKDLKATVKVGSLYSTRPKKEIKNKGNQYYPVEVTFIADGVECPPVTLTRIPFMNDFCVLNVDGSDKVLLSELKSVEEISYDDKSKTLNVVLPHRQVSVIAKSKSLRFKLGATNSIEADKVLIGFIKADGADINLKEYFRNSYILRTMEDLEFKTEGVIEDEIAKTQIVSRYRSENYRLGRMRKTLNKRLTIDKCLGLTLSRDILLPRSATYAEKGVVVTKRLLTELKRNLINEVYVRAEPKVVGWHLSESVTITSLERSARMNDFLKSVLPRYSRFNYLPEDVETNIVFDVGTTLTEDMIEVMYDAGVEKIRCSSNKSLANPIDIYFEQEIVGNYTAKLSDFLDVIPEGLSADDYVYYYGISNPLDIKEAVNPDYLTCHDLLALVSMSARIQTMPELNERFDRDMDFLKKVNLINETFSDSFREIIEPFLRKYKSTIEKFLLGVRGSRDPFIGFNQEWIRDMRNKKLLRETEGVNPISLLTQANRVATVVQQSSSVPIEMRSLAMGFYGRICPYETPAGKNIGLLNTLAIGCKIEDGILLTPYHPIKQSGAGPVVAPTVEYLSAMEEVDHRIGDILDIQMDERRRLKNTKVTARVPAAAGDGEKTTIATIDAHSLDYVSVLPEQHLSPTAMLIPFAASDDGARVSFGLNLIRQSIYVQHSEVPYVITSMYKGVFEYSDTYIKRAKKDGVVVSIDSDTLILQYDGEDEETVEYVPETRVTNDAVTVMNYKVREGDRFVEGQILVDSDVSKDGYFSPGVNVLTGYIPYDGYNYEDAVVLAEYASNKFISVSGNTVEKRIEHSTTEVINISSGNYFKYIPENGIISFIDRKRGTDVRRDTQEPMRAHKAAGILYDIQIETDESGQRTAKAQLLGFNKLGPGDKMSGRHGNKGVAALIEKNSNMPMLLNGRILEAALNPCGVVSRMNIGQELELHTGFVAYLLQIRIETDPFNGATVDDIKLLMSYVYDLANNPDPATAEALNPGLPAELYERGRERHEAIREWEGCFFKDGSAPMYNQQTGKMFEYPITFGISYLLKIMHEVDDKVHSRAGVMEEEYSMLEKQPTKGASRRGGQRLGEMEMHAILAHGAVSFATEAFNEKSDNVELRTNLLLDQVGADRIYDPEETAPRTADMFRYFWEVAGVHVDIDELPPVDYDSVVDRTQFDAKALAKQLTDKNRPSKEVVKHREEHMSDLMSALNDL